MSLRPSTSSRFRFPPAVALWIVCAGALLAPLDSSVNTAFPVITEAFGLPLRDIQWVVVSYVIAQSSLTIVCGRLGDVHGHRRIFAFGLAASALTHWAVAAAASFGELVAARVFQGISVGMVSACAPALATLMFAPADKRRIVAFYVMAINVGMAIGPLLGGLLIAHFDWPGVYGVRVPLALIVLGLVPWLPRIAVEEAGEMGEAPRQRAASFDWLGALLMTAALSGLILALGEATRPAGQRGLALALLAVGIAATIGFVRHESRAPAPLLRIEPFRSPLFASMQGASSVINFACFSILLLVPYVTAAWPGRSIVLAGALLALFPAGAVLGGLAGGRLAVPPATVIHAGLWLAGAGLLATASSVAAGWAWPLAASLLVTGLGHGLFQVGYMDTTTSLLPEHERGIAGSLVSVTRLIGVVFGASGISWLHERLQSFPLTFALLGAGLLAFDLALGRAMRRSAS
ncbi:MAG: MFS transporter [Burkholderiaceae bacterium]